MYDNLLITSWTRFIHSVFLHSFKKEWYETYWVIDMHRTVIRPTYDENDKRVEYYPFAKEVLQILSKRDDIKTIMWTSTSQEDIDNYVDVFKGDNIEFDNINENPDISSNNGNFGRYDKKFYFNVLIDDKAAFFPNEDWEPIYNLLKKYEEDNFLPNPKWTTKY